jgi:hypothetical protein
MLRFLYARLTDDERQNIKAVAEKATKTQNPSVGSTKNSISLLYTHTHFHNEVIELTI